jgi:hypothetical protein
MTSAGGGVAIERDIRWNLFWIALTGALFECGAAFVDAAVVALFVARLTASALAVGAAEAISRFGWLLPQLLAASYAQRLRYRKPIYLVAGWGRAGALGILASVLVLFAEPEPSPGQVGLLTLFFTLWTVFSLVSGLAGVPYNDVVGRAIPADRRSRLLAGRVFVGGALGVGAGVAIRAILGSAEVTPLVSYGLIFAAGAAVLTLSTLCFAAVREPPAPASARRVGFTEFLTDGVRVVRHDARVRLFVLAQLVGGLTTMAAPFYMLQALRLQHAAEADVGTFVAAQTLGALALNPLWGWWGDRAGKLSLLKAVAAASLLGPILAMLLPPLSELAPGVAVPGYVLVFCSQGAVSSGRVVAELGYLMEISPDERRPEYSAYTNALVAPSRLLPLLAGSLVEWMSFHALFGLAAAAVAGRLVVLSRLDRATPRTHPPALGEVGGT